MSLSKRWQRLGESSEELLIYAVISVGVFLGLLGAFGGLQPAVFVAVLLALAVFIYLVLKNDAKQM